MRRRSCGLSAAVLAAALTLAGCGGSDGPTTGSGAGGSTPPGEALPRTPAIDTDFPDPDILRVGRTYYAYGTNGQGRNVQVARSADLRHWQELGGDALPTLPDWAGTGRTWAPDVSATRGGYVMYVTLHSLLPDRQCIGTAVASRPEGPFRPVGRRPLVCPAAAGGAIDPASFVDADGRRYLLWKNDGNCCGLPTWLHLQPMSADGLRTTGPARRLVREDRPWEGDLVEAPTLVRHRGGYVLFYSANDYGGSRYATGYALASRLDGPYRKAGGPLLTTGRLHGAIDGPGGQDVFADATGRWHIALHGWDAARAYRGMYVLDLSWAGDRPVVPGASGP